MRTTITTLTSLTEPYWEYIIPRYENEEENTEATQLIDIIQELNHPDIEGETEALLHAEIVSRLMRSSRLTYAPVDKDRVQELIDRRKDTANTNEYQNIVTDMLESGKLFTIVPKREAIMYLVDTN